jgi:hypothetical protein
MQDNNTVAAPACWNDTLPFDDAKSRCEAIG